MALAVSAGPGFEAMVADHAEAASRHDPLARLATGITTLECDRVSPTRTEKIVIRLAAAAALLSLCACLGTQVPLEGLVTDLDPGPWQIGFEQDHGPGKGYIREWVPKGESIEDWSRLFTIQFLEGETSAVSAFAEASAKARASRCPGTESEVLASTAHSVTQLYTSPDCGQFAAHSEIERLIQGNDGIHRISFSQKGGRLSVELIEEWLPVLQESYIAKGEAGERIR
jgi:hypothetical protein